jgi:hypothetical protein
MKIKWKNENVPWILRSRHFFESFDSTISRVLVSETQNKWSDISSILFLNLVMLRTLGAPRPMSRDIHANHSRHRDRSLQSTLLAIPTCRAPIISLGILEEGIAGNCLSEWNPRSLREDSLLPGLQCPGHHIFHIDNWARTEVGIEITIGSLEPAF